MSALTDYLHDVLSTTGLSDPRLIATELLDRIPEEARADALVEVLAPWVSVAMSRERMLQPIRLGTSSSKVAAVRSDWQSRLNTPLNVAGGWKRLAECTADDLRLVADDLDERARRMVAKADYYRELANHIPAGGTVGMLAADPVGVAA